ncbi:MAG: glycosyltransferase family 4 protein [Deltaproteobacteria bacterium]|nr:glycosyltransferase family 4 protein [Deltaproteobacteria bacterium]
MTRVGHVLASPFPALRGTQGYLFELMRAQAALGHEVHLFCYAGRLDGEVPPRVTLHRSPPLPGVPSALRSSPGLARPVNDLALLGRLLSDPATRRMEVLHGHNHEGGLAALLAGRALGIPVVHQVHGNLEAELESWAGAGRARLLGPLAPLAGLLFDRRLPAASDACLRLRAPEDRADFVGEVLPPGISPAAEQAPGLDRAALARSLGAGPWVAYAGNLDPYQDLPRLFATVRWLGEERPGLRLLIVSHDPPEARERVVQEGGLKEGAVRVVEAPDAAAAARWIVAAGLLLVPRTEPGGLPLKILNAIGLGVPVVTTLAAAAGLGEEAGVVAGGASPEALAEAVLGVIEDPGRRQALQEAAERFTRANTWENVARACETVYQKLTADR